MPTMVVMRTWMCVLTFDEDYTVNINLRWRSSFCVWLLLLVALPVQADPPLRILFVGNSYLYYNDSLHNHVRRIVE